jgi:tRNA A-37 threonylcarbamoyl transferase component Bud32
MLLNTVIEFNRKITTQLRDSVRLVPVLKRKPQILRYWLFSARKEQIIIIALLILLPFVILPALDVVLSRIFSPVTIESLFGLVTREVENPHLHVSELITHWSLWSMAIMFTLYLFLRRIPAALERATQIAREKEQLADQLANSNASESILLYSAALAWSSDRETESQITSKLQELNTRLSQGNHAATVAETPASADGTVMMTSDAQESTSKKALIADRYQIKQQLGVGAMGIVYQAGDLKLNRDVALKQLAPNLATDQQLLARFRQEALALARLSHPNIVQVYDFIEWNGLSLIVMEFVDGHELESRLGHGKALKISEAVRLAMQMADALGYAHDRGVVHRDFKPANVLISCNGEVKITDFGIAKLAASSVHTQMNTVMGTPAYMSPEQANGEQTDQRTDIYALGVVLYQLLAGKRPFEGDMKSIIAQHLSKMPPGLAEVRRDVPPALDAVVQKMLAKKAADRYQSMAVVSQQLRQIPTD